MSQAALARLVDCTPSNVGKAGNRSAFLPKILRALDLTAPAPAPTSTPAATRHAKALAMLERLAGSPDRYVEAIDALRALLDKEREIDERLDALSLRVLTGKSDR